MRQKSAFARELRQSDQMDFRQRSFASQATAAFGDLSGLGFGEAQVEDPADPNRRPINHRVISLRPDTRVEVSLDLAFGGEDTILTTLEGIDGRTTFGPNVARKGREMRKALAEQAAAVVSALGNGSGK